MENKSDILGAAHLGGRLYAARVSDDGARLQVNDLLTADDNFNIEALKDAQLYINVSDRIAVVKKIRVDAVSNYDAEDLVRFEMSQGLLEPPENFYYDLFPIETANGNAGKRSFLSIAYHRREVDDLKGIFSQKMRQPSGFKLNGLALVDGYRKFCRREPGDLKILANFESDEVVIAMLYKEQLYSLGRMESAPGEDISEKRADMFAGEFRMTLDFILTELFVEGITVPPSRIIISGRHARHQGLRAALARHGNIEIELPRMHEGYFDRVGEKLKQYNLEQFLIPLGLAVP